jgi:putative intracellular protease/amidase
MSAEINVTNPAKPKQVLMVIANPATSTTLGIPVGFWGAELAHAWNAFKEVGYEITVASPDAGSARWTLGAIPAMRAGTRSEI